MTEKKDLQRKKRVSWGIEPLKDYAEEKDTAVQISDKDTIPISIFYGKEITSPFFASNSEMYDKSRILDQNIFDRNASTVVEENNLRDFGVISSKSVEIKENTDLTNKRKSIENSFNTRRRSVDNSSIFTASCANENISFDEDLSKTVKISNLIKENTENNKNACDRNTSDRNTIDKINLSFLSNISENDTCDVKEIIDTVDVRKMIGEQKEKFNLDEEIGKYGVRFYHTTSPIKKRETLSRRQSKPDDNLLIYYEHYLSPKYEWYFECSTILEEMMKIKDGEIINQGNFINSDIFKCDEITSSRLMALKQLCRNKAKIFWYGLRASWELDFNVKISANKNKIVNEFNVLKAENDKKKSEKHEKQGEIKKIQQRINDLTVKSLEKRNCANSQTLERILKDKKLVVESYKRELIALKNIDLTKDKEISDLKEKALEIKENILRLETSSRNKNHTESDLEDIKREFANIKSVYDLEIIKYNENNLNIRIGDYSCIFGIVISDIITVEKFSFSVVDSQRKLLLYFALKKLNPVGIKLVDAIRKVLRVSTLVRALIKELRRAEIEMNVVIEDINGSLNISINGNEGSKELSNIVIRMVDIETYSVDGIDVTDLNLQSFGVVTAVVDRMMGKDK